MQMLNALAQLVYLHCVYFTDFRITSETLSLVCSTLYSLSSGALPPHEVVHPVAHLGQVLEGAESLEGQQVLDDDDLAA